MNATVGKTVMEHLFKLPCSKAGQQKVVRKCSEPSLITNMIRKNYLMALAVTCLGALASGCNSNGTANAASEDSKQKLETFAETQDFLNVDEKERPRVDSLLATDVYWDYVDAHSKFQKVAKTMPNEEALQTEEGKAYSEATHALLHVMDDIMKLSPNASTAVFVKASYDDPNVKSKLE